MTQQLLSTQETMAVERLIRRAAAVQFGRSKAQKATPVFEHGHWWITLPNGAIYDVVDSSPSIAGTGLSFEQVSYGDE